MGGKMEVVPDMEAERLQTALRKIARSKHWIQSEEWIYVEYDWREEVYALTVYWIEDWKPGNEGMRMRGDIDIMPGDDLSKALDEARQDALDWHKEAGIYPNDPQRRQEWLRKQRLTE